LLHGNKVGRSNHHGARLFISPGATSPAHVVVGQPPASMRVLLADQDRCADAARCQSRLRPSPKCQLDQTVIADLQLAA
jgi:hypothetical protein